MESDDDLDLAELREQIAEDFSKMTPEEKVHCVRAALEKAPDKIRIQRERIAQLNARIEHLSEQLKSVDGAEQAFLQDQLDESQTMRDEYLQDMEELEDMIKYQRDFLDRNLN